MLPCRQVIEDFGLLSFQPLAVEDRDSMRHLAALIDKSNGFVFAGLAREGESLGDGAPSALPLHTFCWCPVLQQPQGWQHIAWPIKRVCVW